MKRKTWLIPLSMAAVIGCLNAALADRIAVIDSGGKVVNVIEVPDGWSGASGEYQVPAGHTTQPAANAAPHDTWNGSVFVKPAIELTSLVFSYDAFEARFTADEMDAIGEHVYSMDAEGKPKHVRLLQALQRVIARDKVDLLSSKTVDFMDALVAAELITADRKTAILNPNDP
tara:strand:- start:232 stop:750 length:519 start_codon:yes stop_codon:yes gene_type:complete